MHVNHVPVTDPVPTASRRGRFGPVVVDLGADGGSSTSADIRTGLHGLDLAMLFERLWFAIFDPLVAERLPAYRAECYAAAAVSEGVRAQCRCEALRGKRSGGRAAP